MSATTSRLGTTIGTLGGTRITGRACILVGVPCSRFCTTSRMTKTSDMSSTAGTGAESGLMTKSCRMGDSKASVANVACPIGVDSTSILGGCARVASSDGLSVAIGVGKGRAAARCGKGSTLFRDTDCSCCVLDRAPSCCGRTAMGTSNSFDFDRIGNTATRGLDSTSVSFAASAGCKSCRLSMGKLTSAIGAMCKIIVDAGRKSGCKLHRLRGV